MSHDPYPDDFSEWSKHRRDEYFASQARKYREAQTTADRKSDSGPPHRPPAPPSDSGSGDGGDESDRIAVVIGPAAYHSQVEQIETILTMSPPLIFRRGGRIVVPEFVSLKTGCGRSVTSTGFFEIDRARLAAIASKRIEFQKFNARAKMNIVTAPPARHLSAIISGGITGQVRSIGTLRSNLLSQAITQQLLRIRRLGESNDVQVLSNQTFCATGNGLVVAGDLPRRSLFCKLDARLERPEDRTFEFDPVETVLRDRGRYVRAALIIGLFGIRSAQQIAPYAGFESWSSVRRGLVVLGLPDVILPLLSIADGMKIKSALLSFFIPPAAPATSKDDLPSSPSI